MHIEVRPANADDAEPIRLIYNVEVMTSTFTMDIVERTLEMQREWMNQRSGAHAVLVADEDTQIVGFGSLSPWRSRPGYSTTVEDSVYVSRDHHRKGVGTALLGGLLHTARAHGFHTVMARIASDHEASLGLHRSFGFELVGTERQVARKFGKWIDIDVLQVLL